MGHVVWYPRSMDTEGIRRMVMVSLALRTRSVRTEYVWSTALTEPGCFKKVPVDNFNVTTLQLFPHIVPMVLVHFELGIFWTLFRYTYFPHQKILGSNHYHAQSVNRSKKERKERGKWDDSNPKSLGDERYEVNMSLNNLMTCKLDQPDVSENRLNRPRGKACRRGLGVFFSYTPEYSIEPWMRKRKQSRLGREMVRSRIL